MNLLPVVLGGEHESAQALAKWITTGESLEGLYYSHKQNDRIDYRGLIAFLTEKVTHQGLFHQTCIVRNMHAISEIADGCILHNENGSNEMKSFLKFTQECWLPFPSNNHITEAGVKDSNECGSTGRREDARSNYVIGRSRLIHTASQTAVSEKKAKLPSGEQAHVEWKVRGAQTKAS